MSSQIQLHCTITYAEVSTGNECAVSMQGEPAVFCCLLLFVAVCCGFLLLLSSFIVPLCSVAASALEALSSRSYLLSSQVAGSLTLLVLAPRLRL